MELKAAQQLQTEFGYIPNDWESKSIEDLCVPKGLVRGPFGGALKKEFFVENGIKVYEQKNAIYRNVSDGTYYIDFSKFLELKRFEVLEGDFIVSCSGTIGRIYQIPETFEKGIINQALLKITINKNKYSDKYFNHFFIWDKFQDKIIDNTQGGAMKNLVGMPIFKSTKINLPPTLAEQTAIATALSDADALNTQLEKLIAKKRAIKQGAMQELLRPKEGWEEKPLTDFVDYLHGKAHEKDIDENGKYVVVNSKFISSDGTIAKYSNHNFCPAKKGDVLTVLSDLPNGKALAKCYYVAEDRKYAVNQRICIWRSKGPNPKFLFFVLNRHKYFIGLDDGISQTHILNHHIEKCRISAPKDTNEQIRIAKILSDMDNEIKGLERKLVKSQMLKQGMMQNLLTGKIRLI